MNFDFLKLEDRQLLIILNPAAGNLGILQAEEEILKPLLRGKKYIRIYTTKDEMWIHKLRESIFDKTTIISIGGDGTHSMVAKALQSFPQKEQIECLFLPFGRGNDFIRGLTGFTHSGKDFLAWMGSQNGNWVKTKIDLGKIMNLQSGQENLFLNMASIGYGGDVVEKVHHKQKVWSKSKVVYQVEGALSLFSTEETFCRISLDSEKVEQEKFFGGFVGNGKCNGSGLFWTPQAQIDDGALDFIFFAKPSVLQMLGSLTSVKKRRDPAFQFKRMKASSWLIRFQTAVSIELDGDFIGKLEAARFDTVGSNFWVWRRL